MIFLKCEFIDDEHFIIYYVFGESLDSLMEEEKLKLFFKMLNQKLKSRYHYEFQGFYNVTIYVFRNVYVMDFVCVDDFGRADFNITMLLNSELLYEFPKEDMVDGEKIYYQEKYYVELERVYDSPYLLEYGNIIFGNLVEEILSGGILVSI